MANPVIDWIDQRFPFFSFIKHNLTDYPLPRNLSYWWNFGSLAGIALVLQLVTGIFLAMYYKPDVNLAFDSVQHIMRDVNYGWLLRYLHSTGASAFFVIIYIHMARTLYYASYRKPRELIWWTGQVLLLMIMATSFMGYLLPWGQLSYWGAQVITDLFSVIPFFGDSIVQWLRGDFSVGDATLTRFYSLHYLMPFLMFAVVGIHAISLHTVKSSNPTGLALEEKDHIPFHPYFTIKDLFALGVYLTVFCTFVFFVPNCFIEAANNIPANPLITPAHIEPAWYFLPFYAILRAIPNMLGGVVAMGLSIVIFTLLPLVDRSNIPGGSIYRPVYRAMFYLFIIDVVLLGYIGSQSPIGYLVPLSQVATFIYFATFFLLPFVSKWEERWMRARGLPPELSAFAQMKLPQQRGSL